MQPVRIFALLLFFVASCACLQAQAPGPARPEPQTAAAYLADPKVQAELGEAQRLYKAEQYAFAADAYKKANKLAGGNCFECLKGQWAAQLTGKDFKGAINTAVAIKAIAGTPATKSTASYFQANALYQSAGEKPKPDKLEAVHGLLTEAVGIFPKNAAALFLDGKVLAQLGKMEDAKAEFSQCVSCVSAKDPSKMRAEHFAQNPELSLHKMAPAFEVTALDGTKFNLDAMGGRVVLIDFWATRCGPCNEELPHVKAIAKEFAGQPLVILSVSWDSDETKWKDFIAKNGMTWLQYRDADHKLSEEFGINAIPHYFTIDSDGVLTAELVGEGQNVEGRLKKMLAKAQEAQRETAAATSPLPHPYGN